MNSAIARDAILSPGSPDEPTSGSETLQHKTAVVIATSAVMLTGLFVLWMARVALLLLFAGVVLAVMLRTASDWIERRTKLSSGWALSVLLLGSGSLLMFVVWLRGSEISAQVDRLQQRLPVAAREVVETLPTFAFGRWIISHGADPQQIPRIMEIMPKVTGFLSSTLGLFAGLLLVLYVGVTLAAEPHTYLRGIERLFRAEKRPRVAFLLDEVGLNLRRWILARLVSMCGIGLLIGIGLYLLHVPMAGMLASFAAAMTFIPNLGPIVSVIPAALLAFATSPKLAILVIVLFAAAHFIEGWLLTPIVERTAVHLPPALTLAVQLALASVCGAIGVALAAPISVVALVLIGSMQDPKGDGASHVDIAVGEI